MALRYPARVKATSSTTGSGTYNITEITANGYRTFAQAVASGDLADGDTVPYIVVDSGTTNKFEFGVGTFHTGSPPTLARTTVLQPGGAAVSWTTGTRDLLVVDNPATFLAILNNLSDVNNAATARSNLGLLSAAILAADNAANGAVKLTAAGKYPALDGSLITNLAAASIPGGGVNVMVFYQAAAPTGWTLKTTVDDYVIRITKGAGSATGLGGGVTDNSFGGYNTTYGVTSASHALTSAEAPTLSTDKGSLAGGTVDYVKGYNANGAAHSHALSSVSTWRPPSAMCILASKD